MAVAVKTTAIKASAIDGSGAPFRDGIEVTQAAVSKSTITVESAEVTRNEPDAPGSKSNTPSPKPEVQPRSVSDPEHCSGQRILRVNQAG